MREQVVQGKADILLGVAEARDVRVRRVGEEQEHAALTVVGELGEVELAAIDRGLIDLEIPRVDHVPLGRGDGKCHALHRAVRDMDPLDFEAAEREAVARLDRRQVGRSQQGELRDLLANQAKRERSAVDRHVELRQQVRNRSDVIEVGVREDEPSQLVALRLEVGEIGHDNVDAVPVGAGKEASGVNQDHVVAGLQRQRVHAEFAEAADGDYSQFFAQREFTLEIPNYHTMSQPSDIRTVRCLMHGCRTRVPSRIPEQHPEPGLADAERPACGFDSCPNRVDDLRLERRAVPLLPLPGGAHAQALRSGSRAMRFAFATVQRVRDHAARSGPERELGEAFRIAGQDRRQRAMHEDSGGGQFLHDPDALVHGLASRLVHPADFVAIRGKRKADPQARALR